MSEVGCNIAIGWWAAFQEAGGFIPGKSEQGDVMALVHSPSRSAEEPQEGQTRH